MSRVNFKASNINHNKVVLILDNSNILYSFSEWSGIVAGEIAPYVVGDLWGILTC